MSKRKARFVDDGRDEVDMEEAEVAGFKSKHSLDSDEEDDNTKNKYDILRDEDLDGQEDATIDYDGEIKITPFNMKEEMEEGHFDTEGNYYHDNPDEIKDNWIDNIDWVKVKAREPDQVQSEKDNSQSASSDAEFSEEDKISIFRQMLELMKAGENVLKSIKRLGGSSNRTSASNRWLKKKKKTTNEESVESEANKECLEKLTAFADRLLQSGEFEVYQHTFEKISFILKTYDEKVEANKIVIPEGTKDDDALDMFADNLDSKVLSDDSKTESDSTVTPVDSKNSLPKDDEVMWEFKWENEDGAEIHGPHSSSDMQQWVEDGYFPNGVFVRKVSQGPEAQFYTSSRIDFELYI